MSDIPTIVKVLRHLRGSVVHSTYGDIINIVAEGQASVDRALNELTAEGIINSEGQHYSYNATAKAEDFCNKLFALYDRVIKKPQMELLVRGLLCHPNRRYLLKLDILLEVLEKEGFVKEEASRFLEEETGRGYLKTVEIIFITRKAFPTPLYIPLYRRSHLREVGPDEREQLKGACGKSGFSFSEVDYVTGSYPAELAEPAVQYFEKEKKHIKDWLRETAFPEWHMMRQLW